MIDAGTWRSLATTLDPLVAAPTFTGVVRVSHAGATRYERVAGFADRAHEIAHTPRTRFGIASGTKTLTALTVLSLVADGALALDTPVTAVLVDGLGPGDGLGLADGVTVEHLLGHTSGIGDYLDEEGDLDLDTWSLPVPPQALVETSDYRRLQAGLPAKFSPGARFAYCNGGYVVLALVVEAVTGTPFPKAVHERVCAPAGMVDTEFPRMDQLPGSMALGYLDDDDGWRTNHFHLPMRGSGDGGACSTLDDVEALWTALFGAAIVPAALVERMVTPRTPGPPPPSGHGLGVWLRGPHLVHLEGADAGVSFRSVHHRGHRITATVMCNTLRGAWPVADALDAWFDQLDEPGTDLDRDPNGR